MPFCREDVGVLWMIEGGSKMDGKNRWRGILRILAQGDSDAPRDSYTVRLCVFVCRRL